jgi:hypothetical protein
MQSSEPDLTNLDSHVTEKTSLLLKYYSFY